jgi:hypothetical protein
MMIIQIGIEMSANTAFFTKRLHICDDLADTPATIALTRGPETRL